MKKAWLIVASLVLAVALLGMVGCVPSSSEISGKASSFGVAAVQQPTGISVTGEGRVRVKPDIAILNLGVEAEAEKVVEAHAQAAEAMNKVIKAGYKGS